MARIVFYSMAHRGDVFPYVPVAAELARRGHDVTYVVPREFHPLFEAEPFACVHSGTDFAPSTLDAHGPFLARWGTRMGGVRVLRLYLGELTVPHLPELFEAIDGALAGAHLLVAHPSASLVGAMACERRDLPWIVGDLFPMLVPTATEPPATGLPDLGPAVNRRLWRLTRSAPADRLAYGPPFRSFPRSLGLPAPRRWNTVDARLSPYVNLALVSARYAGDRPDWPANYRFVGFTPWVGPDQGALPEEVTAFLDAGDPPVVVTLGTSGASARPELFTAAARALDEAGVRGLFLTSNRDATERLRSDGVGEPHGIWPFAPLVPLLPRARAVVHSGAHGTNALVLGAGLPSVVLPCLFDQLWHARRQEELGTGVWVRRPTELGAALARVLGEGEMADRARALAAELATEDGTARASDEIEAFLAA